MMSPSTEGKEQGLMVPRVSPHGSLFWAPEATTLGFHAPPSLQSPVFLSKTPAESV